MGAIKQQDYFDTLVLIIMVPALFLLGIYWRV